MNLEEQDTEKGTVYALCCVVIFVLLASTAIAVDAGLAYMEQHRMQLSADAASLYGAQMIADGETDPNDIRNGVQIIASANGLPPEVVAAGGGIELGQWEPGTLTFLTDAVPYRAVRVLARANLPSFFGSALGYSNLQPAVGSISIAQTSGPGCAAPFGVEEDLVENLQGGDSFELNDQGDGNWGKIDVCEDGAPTNCMSAYPTFYAAILSTVCEDPIQPGDTYSPGTGSAAVPQGFRDRMAINPFIKLPLVECFPDNNSGGSKIGGKGGGGSSNNTNECPGGGGNSEQVLITDCANFEIKAVEGQGKKWTLTLEFIELGCDQGAGGGNEQAPVLVY